MARSEQAIFTNLCMVYDDAGNILVQDRLDPAWPGLCFPGGNVEPGESFVESVIREVWEETGLTIENPILCGTKQFQTDSNERYVVLFYKTNHFSGQLKSSDEGKVFWIPREDLVKYTLCEDFPDMVKIFESDCLSEFYYYTENGDWKLKLLYREVSMEKSTSFPTVMKSIALITFVLRQVLSGCTGTSPQAGFCPLPSAPGLPVTILPCGCWWAQLFPVG